MGLDERDYVRGKHPPACTCVGCLQRRLRRGYGDDPVGKRQAILSVSRRRHAQINFKPLIVWLITVGLVFVSIFALGCPVAPEPTPEYPPTQPVITPEPAPECPPSAPVIAPEPAPEPPPTEPAIAPKPGPRDIVEEANFEAIDYHALNVAGLGWECVESLAVYLTEPARNDLEIARAIFRWITHNIAYDARGFLAGDFGCQSPEAVLERGYAVCGGYAKLFDALAYAAGLEAEVIGGWARGFGYEIGEPVDESPNHAWNAVKIGDGWYLLEPTWAAGHLDDMRFVRRFSEFYFLTCPAELIYSHFPRNPDWQLLQNPITKQQFAVPPLLGPMFFQEDLELVTHTQGVIRTEQQVIVSIVVPAGTSLVVELSQDDHELPRRLTFVQRKGDIYQIDAVFPQAGEYILRIFAGKRGVEYFRGALDYKIIVNQGMPGPIGFPKIFRTFHEREVFLYTPRSGYLQSGTSEKFKLRVPGAQSVAVIIGDQWHHLTKYNELFEGIVGIAKGEIRVTVLFPDEPHYYGVLQYTGF